MVEMGSNDVCTRLVRGHDEPLGVKIQLELVLGEVLPKTVYELPVFIVALLADGAGPPEMNLSFRARIRFKRPTRVIG
jgi:hypothetical protein